MPGTTLRLQLLLIQKEAALLKRQEISLSYTGELRTVTMTKIWIYATFFNYQYISVGGCCADTSLLKQNPVLTDFLIQDFSCFLLITMKLNEANREHVLRVNETACICKTEQT